MIVPILEMVACVSGQGRSIFFTTGVVELRRGWKKWENADPEHKTPFPKY
jgi:hypothetical protein